MNQKTKAIGVIVIILLITTWVGMYLFKKNKTAQPIPQIVNQVPEAQQSAAQTQTQPQENSAVTVPAQLPSQKVGTVSMVDPKFITIEEIGGSFQSAITNNTLFFKREGSGRTKTAASSVKVGSNVLLKLNTETGEILEVEII